jgi:uncharacterized protein (DUF1501 family)
MTISRRSFLRGGLTLAGACVVPAILLPGAQAQTSSARKLVVIHLSGGNDGLNTIVPYANGAYYDARAELAISQEVVLPISNELGLHPSMTGMRSLFDQKHLAIVQAVGYPEQNRSHFRSADIWQTGYADRISETGWLGRYLDGASAGWHAENQRALERRSSAKELPAIVKGWQHDQQPALNFDDVSPVSLHATKYSASSFAAPNLLTESGTNKFCYPDGRLGAKLQAVANSMRSGCAAQIFTASLDGFDTHANQPRVQAPLLAHLSQSISAFFADLTAQGKANEVLVLMFSEFGRRVPENGGGGTDHGSSQPLLIVGGAVKGGVYGEHASLTNLHAGDLRSAVDFRTVYATILDRWLAADSTEILGRNYEHIPFV